MPETQYDRMSRRAMDRHWSAKCAEDKKDCLGPASKKMALGLLRAGQGRPTVFKHECRPGIIDVGDEFYPNSLPELLSDIDPEGTLGRVSHQGRHDDAHPCWNDLKTLPYLSLHDSRLTAWVRDKDRLAVEFDGSFSSTSGNYQIDKLMLVFDQPRVRILWDGGWLCEPGIGCWRFGQTLDAPFLSRRRLRGKPAATRGFDGLGSVHCDELSVHGDPCQEIRWQHSWRGREQIAVAFDQVFTFLGAAAVESYWQRLDLQKQIRPPLGEPMAPYPTPRL